MQNTPKTIEDLVEEFEKKFPQLCVVIKHNEPLDNITNDVVNYFRQALSKQDHISRESIKEAIKNCPIDKAHTYSSENADIYRAYDNGQENYKEKILQTLNKE